MNLPYRYKLERKIAEGWSSFVYEGYMLRSSELISVVFKYLKKDIPGQNFHKIKKYIFEAFMREAIVLNSINHKSIPTFYEILWIEESPCIVMQKIEGSTLLKYSEENELSWSIVKTIVMSLLKTLEFVHSRKVLFCDINPSNIIISSKNEVYLIDFGAVQLINFPSYWAYPLGRHRYMGPEVLLKRNEEIPYSTMGISSDIHQVGCLLYYLVSGREPFRRPLETEDYNTEYLDALGYYMNQPIQTKMNSFKINIDVTDTEEKCIYDFISKALMANPLDRFQTCNEMRYSLNNI